MAKKKKYGKGGPQGSDYIGNPMGYFADRREYMREGGGFEPYLSEDKTIYYTSENSGVIRPKGFRNINHAKRYKKRRDKKLLRNQNNSGTSAELFHPGII